MPERRMKYSPEFKDEAVKLVVETSRPVAEVAREIQVNVPGKSGGLLRPGVSEIAKYEFIDAQKGVLPRRADVCVGDGVAFGFYDWCSRPTSATAARRRELAVMIASVFDGSDASYGYRRVHAELRRGQVVCSLELVGR